MKLTMVLLSLLTLAIPAAADTVVAADGSGQFKTVQQAVDSAPSHSRARFVIHIKPGIYEERVTVPPEKTYLTLKGDDALTTVITAAIHAGMPGPGGSPLNAFGTPTVFIQANDFTAENLTFENSAGRQGEALALTIMSDRGIFRNCRFLGYQDTLLAQAGRQYFDHCYIAGAIFGGSEAWFEGCEIHVKAEGYITAPNTPKDQHYGYAFSHCKISSEPNVRTFLSRPLRPYAATVFLNTEMSDAVEPAGWNNLDDRTRGTARYAEYRSTGPGSGAETRVKWGGPHQLTDAQAREFSVETVLSGIDGWDPLTGTVRSAVLVTKPPGTSPTALIAKDSVWIASTASASPADDLHLAYSNDGFKWTAIARPVLTADAKQKPMIDPRLVEGPDGTFYLIWATGAKGNKGFGYARSKDLLHWPDQAYVAVMANQEALDLASPNLSYDEVSRRFVITWASTIDKNFIQSFQEPVDDNPRIWYATTRDFGTFTNPELLFDPNYSVKDGVILEDRGHYVLLHNDNTRPMLNLRTSISSTPFGPWGPSSDAFTNKFTASPAPIQSGREWWIFYTNTETGTVGLLKTRDFRTFQDASSQVAFPEGRHPVSILKISRTILDQLL